MRIRTSLKPCGVVTGVALLACVSLASPASAAGTLTDNGNGTVTFTYSGLTTEYGWIVCTGTTPSSSCNGTNLVGRLGFTQTNALAPPPGASPAVIQVGTSYYSWGSSSTTTLVAGTYTFSYFEGSSTATGLGGIGGVSIGSSSNPSSSGTSTSTAPSSIVQQFVKPASGTCDAAQPVGVDWSGVASGGWSESWAQWANGGSGGPVCTRSLVYSLGSGSWGLG